MKSAYRYLLINVITAVIYKCLGLTCFWNWENSCLYIKAIKRWNSTLDSSKLYWHLSILLSHNRYKSLPFSLIKSHWNIHCIVSEKCYVLQIETFQVWFDHFKWKISNHKSKAKLNWSLGHIFFKWTKWSLVKITDFQSQTKLKIVLTNCSCFRCCCCYFVLFSLVC